jgi:hypothetical protein
VNDILISKAEGFFEKGIPIVIDGNFYWKSQIEYLTKRLRIKGYIFTLNVPLEVV